MGASFPDARFKFFPDEPIGGFVVLRNLLGPVLEVFFAGGEKEGITV